MTLLHFTRSHLRRLAEALGSNDSLTHQDLENLWLEFTNGTDLAGNSKAAKATDMVNKIAGTPNAEESLLEIINEVFYESERSEYRRQYGTFTRLRESLIGSGFTDDHRGMAFPSQASKLMKESRQKNSQIESATSNQILLSKLAAEKKVQLQGSLDEIQRLNSEPTTKNVKPRIEARTVTSEALAKPKPPSQQFEPIAKSSTPSRKRSVFIVHGRDMSNKNALVALLKQMDIRPITWNEAVSLSPSQNTLDIVMAGINHAQAVIILFTPDDLARLKNEFLKDDDGPHERNETGQARPNVILEAGIAYAKEPTKTIFARVGKTREISDIAGFNWVQLSQDYNDRDRLRRELLKAGVELDHTTNLIDEAAGKFEI